MLAHAFAWSKTIKNIQNWFVCMKKKVLFHHFLMFLIVFDHAFAGRNTQQLTITILKLSFYFVSSSFQLSCWILVLAIQWARPEILPRRPWRFRVLWWGNPTSLMWRQSGQFYGRSSYISWNTRMYGSHCCPQQLLRFNRARMSQPARMQQRSHRKQVQPGSKKGISK